MADSLARAICDLPGCGLPAMPCWLPSGVQEQPAPWLCATHAAEEGYCAGCGLFSAGSEAFDFAPSGLCAACQEQARVAAKAEDEAQPFPWDQRP